MLEWLKNILGDSYTADIDSKVSAEIGKSFVSKADFNQANTAKKKAEDDLKERDKQLEDLKKSSGDAQEMQKKIKELQDQNKAAQEKHAAEMAQLKLDTAVEAALTAAGARNNTAVKALLTDFLKDAQLAEDGTVKGLAAELENMAKADGTAFLFNSQTAQQYKGMQPGQAGGKNPPPANKEPKDMNYEELCAYHQANPNAKL